MSSQTLEWVSATEASGKCFTMLLTRKLKTKKLEKDDSFMIASLPLVLVRFFKVI